MKLHLSILEKLIELPTKELQELRQLFDDVGLEVKGSEVVNGRAQFTIEALANRGDRIPALGVARELAARLLTGVTLPPAIPSFDDRRCSLPIKRNSKLCMRYGMLELVVPQGMQLRPEVAGVLGDIDVERHAIVHLLNYLLLEIGHPMHAFDRDKIDGEVVIEQLAAAEEIVALDGKSYTVPAQSLVIKDRKKIIAVAGVIGCLNSCVTAQTTKVAVESALFDPVSVRLTARAMGLSTDASYLFERGADIENCGFALRRLAYLVSSAGGGANDLCSAQVVGFTMIEGEPTEKRKIPLSIKRIREEMNLPRMSEVEITTRLKHLGYKVESSGEELQYTVTVPSWRLWDVRNPEDLTEDIACAHGFNRVKLELPPLDYNPPAPEPLEELVARIEPALHAGGFFEVITKGFYASADVALLEKLNPGFEANHVRIQNAIDGAYSHMKATNILHLARVCEQSRRYGVGSSKVYEFGRIFDRTARADQPYEHERDMLSLAALGRWSNSDWRKPEPLEEQLRSFRGVLDGVAIASGVQFEVAAGEQPFLHPGIQGVLKVGRTTVGSFGVLHPQIAEALSVTGRLLFAEIDLERLLKVAEPRRYGVASDLPAVWRDLTLKLEERSRAGDAARWMQDAGAKNLRQVAIVDTFKREDESFRRVSFRLIFRDNERTLSSAEVDAEMQQVLGHLKQRHSIEMAM